MVRAFLLASVALAWALPAVAAADDDDLPRVISAPTAWIPARGTVVATGGAGVGAEGIGDAGEAMLSLGYGLGDLASVELGGDRDVRGCARCGVDGEDAMAGARGIWLGRASFRIGTPRHGRWSRLPALALGLRTTWAARGHTFGAVRASEAYAAASWRLGPTRVHGGVSAFDARGRDARLGVEIRPFAGLEWTPSDLPRSSLLVDVTWMPRLAPDEVVLEWVAGAGVRYQALTWGSIELAVRNREDDGLRGTTVMVRLNGVVRPSRAGRAAAR